MGAYLTTNLNTFFQYSKKGADQRMLDANSGLEIITQPIIGDSRIFDFVADDDWYVWHLKPEILKDHLHDLLKKYYLELYGEGSCYSNSCREILAAIQSTEDVMTYVTDNPHKSFLYRESRESYYHDQSRHDYFLGCFQLSAEGKVVTYGAKKLVMS